MPKAWELHLVITSKKNSNSLKTKAHSTFKDINLLAEKTAEVVDAVVRGNESKLNFKDTSDNNKIAVPTYFCPSIVLDKDNVKGGYYTESELE